MRTEKGRVVYDRRAHFFSLRDVERILRNMSWEAESERYEIIPILGQILLMVLEGFASTLEKKAAAELGPWYPLLRLLAEKLFKLITIALDKLGTSIQDFFNL